MKDKKTLVENRYLN